MFNSSVGASSYAVPVNAGSVDWTGQGMGSLGRSCRPWDRGDLLRRLATFKPSNWLGKPKVSTMIGFFLWSKCCFLFIYFLLGSKKFGIVDQQYRKS